MTAPLAGALLYIAQSGDVLQGALVLFALGLGMGVPLLLLVTLGNRYLPRPGAWMDRVKAVFGFVFLATKMGSALGKLLSGTTLDAIGFPKGATSIPAEVVDTLAWVLIGSVVLIGGTSYYFWSKFNLPKSRHRQILAELAARRSNATPQAS